MFAQRQSYMAENVSYHLIIDKEQLASRCEADERIHKEALQILEPEALTSTQIYFVLFPLRRLRRCFAFSVSSLGLYLYSKASNDTSQTQQEESKSGNRFPGLCFVHHKA